MADTAKTIKNANNSELSNILNRVRRERDCLQLIREIQASSTSNPKHPYPDWEKLGPFSTETTVYNGKSIKEMTDRELDDYLDRLRNENEIINVIQNIIRFNQSPDNKPMADSTPYAGLDLNTPIKDLYHTEIDQTLKHFGISGMHWGVRRSQEQLAKRDAQKQEKKLNKADEDFRISKNVEKLTLKQTNNLYSNPKVKKDMADLDTEITKKYAKFKNDDLTDKMYQRGMCNIFDKYLKEDPATYSPLKTTRVSWTTVEPDGGRGNTYVTPVLLNVEVKHISDTINIGSMGYYRILSGGKIELIISQESVEENMSQSDVSHTGILGMRWGVRRATGSDGRVSSGEKAKKGSEDYQKARDLKKKGYKNLSDKELRDLTNRMNLERNFRDLKSSDSQRGLDFLKTATAIGTTVASAYALSQTPLGKSVITAIKERKYPKQISMFK